MLALHVVRFAFAQLPSYLIPFSHPILPNRLRHARLLNASDGELLFGPSPGKVDRPRPSSRRPSDTVAEKVA